MAGKPPLTLHTNPNPEQVPGDFVPYPKPFDAARFSKLKPIDVSKLHAQGKLAPTDGSSALSDAPVPPQSTSQPVHRPFLRAAAELPQKDSEEALTRETEQFMLRALTHGVRNQLSKLRSVFTTTERYTPDKTH